MELFAKQQSSDSKENEMMIVVLQKKLHETQGS